MDDIGKRGAVTMGIEAAHVGRRLAVHHPDHALDRLQHARNASEGQRRGAKTYDLAIFIRLPTPDNLDGISGRVGIVEALVQPIERGFQLDRSILQSAICNLQFQ